MNKHRLPNVQLSVIAAIVVTLAAMLVGLGPHVAEASVYNGSVQFTCTDVDATDTGSHVLDRDNTGSGEEALRVEVTDGAGTVIFRLDYQTALGTYGGGIGDFTYTRAPQFNPLTFTLISKAGNGLPEQVDFVATGECPGLPYFAGPDLVPIPEHAVGGAFVTDTPIYFAPEPGAATDIVMEQGKTVWVYGLDESRRFYQVMLAGKLFWVPVDTIGPNYDEVWRGTPLPTVVVE